VYNQWNGLLDWNTGMDYLNGIVSAGLISLGGVGSLPRALQFRGLHSSKKRAL